ncbi:PadR family transcriptional regulator [Luteipulveratus mongoliensis]|uniref:Transcription regulator PadR N-terminal domain-containing protein n=1 Tax=Luteipulveratus mongoliensis TaxID=571913 RepID=A0A0K1JJU1_9MICO|nr:PadR family transcriptional regulator [Luteipulveratus mongoliensis]AKU16976.1 hypothetical protein VV02_15770 [Luteipulveratus mongoliensis]
MNGYQVIKSVAERTDGLWRPGPGSVYPALGLLEDEGLIQPEDSDSGSRKVFALTDEGKAYVEAHADELDEPWDKVTSPHQAFVDLQREVGQLGAAVQQVAIGGDEQQIAAVRSLLVETRKTVYRTLAGDSGTTVTD